MIEGGNKPRKITRTDELLNYSLIIREQEARENNRLQVQEENERKRNEKYLMKLEKKKEE